MNHSALDSQQAFRGHAEGLQKELAPFGTSLDPQSLISGSQLGLQDQVLERLGGRIAAIRNIHLHVMICCIRLCELPF